MWQPPLQGKSQQVQIDACHQPRLLPQLDLRNRILSVRLPSQFERRVQHSLGESQGGASSAVLLPETSLLTVLMYRVRAIGNSSSLSGRRFSSPVFVMFVFASESVITLSSGVTAIQAKEN